VTSTPPDSDRPLVIGIGNDFRRDDGVGLAVVRRLRALEIPQLSCLECLGDAASLLEAWGDRGDVVLVDAMVSGAPPGSVLRLDLRQQALAPSATLHSTHALSISDAVQLADALGRLPQRLVLYAVEAADVGYGEALSADVERAVEPLALRLAAELSLLAISGT
jgi:hydrogenase maturation protease